MQNDQIGETVIHQSHQMDRERSISEVLDGWHGWCQQLSIAGKAIHQPEPVVEIVERLELEPSPQRPRRRRHGLQPGEVGWWKYVGPGVDTVGQGHDS